MFCHEICPQLKEGSSVSLNGVRLEKETFLGCNYMCIYILFLYFNYEQNKLKTQKPLRK